MALTEYRRKRNFAKTSEPSGRKSAKGQGRRFVIQKHDASRLHYDFRLELEGTLKSWALPKGMPYAKGEKRLAVQVEDHPISYIDFEGTIPKGQYGGGTVMVWDRGIFEPLSSAPVRELEGGKLHFVLSGKKLTGEWYLVRLRDPKQWLMIKGGSDLRPVTKTQEDCSVISAKSMRQLAESDQVWESQRKAPKGTRVFEEERSRAGKISPHFVAPMKARLVDSPPDGDWIYEIKLDGFRAIAIKDAGEVELLSRNKKDFSQKFPEVHAALKTKSIGEAILDGEIVALDKAGRSSFQLLQAYELGQERPPIFYYVFDLLWLDGQDLKSEPLSTRKKLLAKLLKNPPDGIRYSASLDAPVDQLLKQARRLRLEGLIGKRADSGYEPGRRSGAWIKLKLHAEQEFVIGGCTQPEGSRQHFGALLVGYFDRDRLKYAGKVGTGFDEASLRDLQRRFEKIPARECPFENLPELKASRYSQGLTAAEMRRCRWLKPKLVCQVKFAEWTSAGKLRQPVFLGLREDKDPTDVVREVPA